MILSYSNLFCIVCIILAIRFMSSPKSAIFGSYLGILGIISAIIFAFIFSAEKNLWLAFSILIGAIIGIWGGKKIKISALPQMIAILNGFGGAAAVCISIAETKILSHISLTSFTGGIIGAVTLTGSLIAFCKLQGIIKEQRFFVAPLIMNIGFIILICTLFSVPEKSIFIVALTFIICLIWGIFLVFPIGGADMPIVISVLNSLSGWATVFIGFSQENILMITIGTIVGGSGAILAHIMTKAMNTSLLKLFIRPQNQKTEEIHQKTANEGSPRDAAFIMENSQKIIIVPGFGMAAASAQYSLKNMADILQKKYNVDVKFAIHPVAGRMPGHMNVLLAEAGIDYEMVFELDDINSEFSNTDVVYVIGANDITNPEAQTNPSSPLYGMPILEVNKAKVVFFVKRTLGVGYSGAENPLFFASNTIMLYGDAKKVTEEINKNLDE